MINQKLLDQIVLNSKVMVGKPIIKGTRLTIEYIFNLPAHGATVTEMIEEYDALTTKDIQACFLLATNSLKDMILMPLALEMA